MEQNNTTCDHVEKISLSRSLKVKVFEAFDTLTLSETLKMISLILLSMFLTGLLVRPDLLQSGIIFLLKFYNYLVPKFIATLLIVFNSTRIMGAVKRMRPVKKTPRAHLIEGIPAVEILDHIFTEGSFKREEVKKKFGIPHDRCNRLAQKLEDLGVFVRRENNARVLNPDMSRQDVAAILEGKTEAKELQPTMKKVSAGSWTVDPIGPRIQERVEKMLTSTPPVFTMKRLRA
jgi:hypothetical protein